MSNFTALAGVALALAAVAAASCASAGVTVIKSAVGSPDSFSGGTFTLQLPKGAAGVTTGVYGVEARVGKGNADWEVGVGPGTSQPGYFHQANVTWGLADTWSLTWNATGIAFQVDGKTVNWGAAAALTGNTLKIYNKGGAVTLKDIGGVALATPVTIASGDSAIFYSPTGFAGGLTADGTISLPNYNGVSGSPKGSSNEVLFKEGTWAPTAGVPEPAAWTMMIVGVGAIGLMARRRRAGFGAAAVAA